MMGSDLGSGIGSGIVLNGQIVRGASGAAGEIGHIKLSMNDGPLCGCGDRGCLEAYASGPSIVAMAKEYVEGGKSAKFKELANPDITPYIVCEAAKQGDRVALKIFDIMGKYIGIGLAGVINLLNPERVIIGGGVADAGNILFDPIKRTIAERAMPVQAQAAQIVPAQLANSAGVIGASLLTGT